MIFGVSTQSYGSSSSELLRLRDSHLSFCDAEAPALARPLVRAHRRPAESTIGRVSRSPL
jgi:hypothetical protein